MAVLCMEESQKNEFIIKLTRQFYEDCVAVYLLDNEERVYETLKSEKYFESIVPDKGSLKSLYRMILVNDTEGKENANSKYAVFTDESLFRRNRYQGSLTLNIHNEKKNFEINIIKIDDRLSPQDRIFFIRTCQHLLHFPRFAQNLPDLIHRQIAEMDQVFLCDWHILTSLKPFRQGLP